MPKSPGDTRGFRAVPILMFLLSCLAAGPAAGAAVPARVPAARRVPAKLPLGMTTLEADTLLAHYAKDRSDTEEWLKGSPTSYLATVLRKDFGDRKSLTVGSAPGNEVRIEDPGVKPGHLRVTVVGDSFRVETLDPAARFQVKDVAMTSAMLPPSGIKVARFSLRLSHQRFPAIIVFDPKSPRYKLYKGIKYFPPDLSYHIVAALKPNTKPDTTMVRI